MECTGSNAGMLKLYKQVLTQKKYRKVRKNTTVSILSERRFRVTAEPASNGTKQRLN